LFDFLRKKYLKNSSKNKWKQKTGFENTIQTGAGFVWDSKADYAKQDVFLDDTRDVALIFIT